MLSFMYVYYTSRKILKNLNSEDFPQAELIDFRRMGLRAALVSRSSPARVQRFS